MAKRDFYETLDVARGADDQEIKRAYRRLAKQYHPDRNPGDPAAEKKFKAVSEAYEVLKDAQMRAAYDRFGHAAFEHGAPGGSGGMGGFGGDFAASMSDIFGDLFGGFMGAGGRAGAGRGGMARGGDLRFDLTISLETAFQGGEKEIEISAAQTCPTCRGTGAKTGSAPQTCRQCGGHGAVRMSQGFFMMERTCPACRGAGQTIADPCAACRGEGRVGGQSKLMIRIPPGIESGTQLRLAGHGEAGGRGGPPGDLYVFVKLRPHEIFQRRGRDLLCALPVAMTTAALGGAARAPLPEGGAAQITIPEGCQPGHRLRLRGKGMPGLEGRGRGDLYVSLQIEVPVGLSGGQKTALRQFAKSLKPDNSPRTEGFFAQVKRAFHAFRS